MRGIIGLKFEWWFNDCNESRVNASRLRRLVQATVNNANARGCEIAAAW
jgi:hypothetical protein